MYHTNLKYCLYIPSVGSSVILYTTYVVLNFVLYIITSAFIMQQVLLVHSAFHQVFVGTGSGSLPHCYCYCYVLYIHTLI